MTDDHLEIPKLGVYDINGLEWNTIPLLYK